MTEAHTSRADALQQEKPPQREARTLRAAHAHYIEKAHAKQRRPSTAQSK